MPKLKNLKQQLFTKFENQDILEVLKHSKNYLSGDLATKAIALISLPIITRLLSPADYGTVEIFQSYILIFVVIFTLNFHGSIARYYYDEPNDFGEFISTSIAGSFFFLAISLFVTLFFPSQIAEMLGISKNLLILLFPVISVSVIHAIFQQLCISRKDSARYTIVNILRVYLGLGLGIALIFVFSQQRYIGPIAGRLLASIIVAIYVVRWLAKEVRWGLRMHHIQFIFSYSIPLVPYTLSNVILGQFDRIMINKSLGASDAGLYSLAYNVGLLVSMTTGALQSALTPDWFRLMREKEYQRVDAIIDKVFKLTLFVALGTILFSQEIIMILADKQFHTALPVIPIVIIGYIFDSVFKIYGRSIGFTNKMVYVTIVGIVAGGVNVVLNLIYIPRFGYIAAAYTTVVSFAVMAFCSWWIAKYHLKQHVTHLAILYKPTLFFLIGVFLYYGVLIIDVSFIGTLLLKGIIFLLITILLFKKSLNLN